MLTITLKSMIVTYTFLLAMLGAPSFILASNSYSDGNHDESTISAANDNMVIEAFNKSDIQNGDQKSLDEGRHKILFIMGASLLLLILLTAGLGIAMAIHGKDVFVAHMLSAGLSVTLAIAHSIVAIVWFFPFG